MTGGPEVLQLEEVVVGSPARVRRGSATSRSASIPADTYFRSGLYPMALPAGMGVEASGVVECRRRRDERRARRQGDLHGLLNTLGAYSTSVMPAAL